MKFIFRQPQPIPLKTIAKAAMLLNRNKVCVLYDTKKKDIAADRVIKNCMQKMYGWEEGDTTSLLHPLLALT